MGRDKQVVWLQAAETPWSVPADAVGTDEAE